MHFAKRRLDKAAVSPSLAGMSDLPSAPPATPGDPEWDGVWDKGALRRLMGLAGPEAAAEILHHLRADLATACATLEAARTARDGAALHRTAHVLIALCGTVGASALCALAERLHHLVDQGGEAPDAALNHADALIGGIATLCLALAEEAALGP